MLQGKHRLLIPDRDDSQKQRNKCTKQTIKHIIRKVAKYAVGSTAHFSSTGL